MHFTTSTPTLSAALLDPVRAVIERGLTGSALAFGTPSTELAGEFEVREDREAAARRPARANVARPGLDRGTPAIGRVAGPGDAAVDRTSEAAAPRGEAVRPATASEPSPTHTRAVLAGIDAGEHPPVASDRPASDRIMSLAALADPSVASDRPASERIVTQRARPSERLDPATPAVVRTHEPAAVSHASARPEPVQVRSASRPGMPVPVDASSRPVASMPVEAASRLADVSTRAATSRDVTSPGDVTPAALAAGQSLKSAGVPVRPLVAAARLPEPSADRHPRLPQQREATQAAEQLTRALRPTLDHAATITDAALRAPEEPRVANHFSVHVQLGTRVGAVDPDAIEVALTDMLREAARRHGLEV